MNKTIASRLRRLWGDLLLGIPDEERDPEVKFAVLQQKFFELVDEVDDLEFRMDDLEH
jgi:hypothetical protein